jgi:hypothetical protein
VLDRLPHALVDVPTEGLLLLLADRFLNLHLWVERKLALLNQVETLKQIVGTEKIPPV